MTLTLERIKEHLRIDIDDEDSLITGYWNAAQGYIEKYLGDDLPDPMPDAIAAAVLLLIGDLYEHRERQGPDILYKNHTYQLLLAPFRTTEVLG
ncbi:head-tail connector protein [Marinobacter nauticus]|uniref:head-tail connector protein n=1 Tax=Marinobacter nauticus TaxID=2743 RepID=UPI001C999F60|nr:head-tail connector protein [Marinobacter nauticus]MBY5963775.1 head-tail connector protein [Marinobacter nauticus]